MFNFVEFVMPYLTALAVSMPRILIALFLIPIFSTKFLQGPLRYAVIIAIAMPVSVTIVPDVQNGQLLPLLLGVVILKEAMVGFVIGFLLAIPFWVFQSVGVMIDSQRGALSGGYFAPGVGPDSSMMSEMLIKVLMMLLITMGAFPAMFGVLWETYTLWPILDWTPNFSQSGVSVLIGKFGEFTRKFVMYSGPIVLVLLLIEAAFAILGTYCPQLQVYFMAMPAKSLVALIVFLLYSDNLWYSAGRDLMEYHDLKDLLPRIFDPIHP